MAKQTMIERVFSLREVDVREKYKILTPREKEVAMLMSRDMKNTEIATALEISPKTLDIHRSIIRRKLGVKNSSSINNYALFYRYLMLAKNNEPATNGDEGE